MKRFILLLLTSVFSYTVTVYAFYFRSYQVEDGLSHNSVWAVMQDSKGFLWFGTNDGLNRFDGVSFKIFRNQDSDSLSIGNNFIHCLKEDSQQRFFVGTKKGLYLYDANLENFRRVNLNRTKENDASINALLETPEGYIWVACHGHGLYLLDADLKVKKHYTKGSGENGLSNDYIWSVVQDYVGNIWLGTVGDGLVHFDPRKEVFTKMIDDDFDIKDPIINSLYCDIDYNLWVGTASNGLYRYNYRTGKVYNYMNREAYNIKAITEYSDHELIMGCDKGLVAFNYKNESFRMLNNDFDNMTDNAIFSISKDSEGSFWIGTYFGGVNYFSPAINQFSYYYNSPQGSLRKNIVSSFAQDENGKIWVGTYNDGLALFNSKTERFENTHVNLSYQNIQDLYFDDEKLYISFYGQGIHVLDLKSQKIQQLSDNPNIKNIISDFVTTVFKSSKGVFFFCSEDGVSCYDHKTKNAIKIEKLYGRSIKDVVEDYTGAIWFAGHTYGLSRLNSDDTWTSFTHKAGDTTSLPNNNVNCIYQDSKLRIWIGMEGDGLVLFNAKTEQFETMFSEQNGLPSNIVYSIMDDSEGNLWVTTGGGLVKIQADLKSIEQFGYLNDIQKIRYNPKGTLRAMDDRLYFGGTNGFIAFHPKDIISNAKCPELAITGFQISSKEVYPNVKSSPLVTGVNSTHSIILERNQSTFSFDFVSLSFVSPGQNQYAYMLKGFDTDWHYTINSKAYYMNLPAGEYVFMVKGSNNDGVWSEVRSIQIKVKPFFLASMYMILLYLMIVITIIMYLFWRYDRRVKAKNQEKLYKYQTEKEKEIYQAKIDFFTNIAHEIRTPLSLITAPLESIIMSDDGNMKTKNNLDIIKTNTNRLLELINQLLDFRKVEENMFHYKFHYQDVVKIVHEVYNQYYQNARLDNLEMNFKTSSEVIKSTVDSEAIYKIISNLLSNAVKYAHSKIDVNIEVEDDQILISVKNDGVALDNKYFNRIFEPFFQVQEHENNVKMGSGLGLSLSKSLAEKHNGSININSKEKEGCMFVLRIPITGQEERELVLQDTITDNSHVEVELIRSSLYENRFKIIVVEDNHDLRDFLVNSLSEDYIVFEAKNGFEALAVLEQENIDVIISDIMMPEMDGLELCNQVKTNIAYSHISFILLSAKTDTPTKIKGLNRGADVYLEKPFSLEQLKAQINSIIENRNNIRNNFIKSPLQYFKKSTNENPENAAFIEKLNVYILENMLDEKFSIDNLSELFYMSRSNFHKKIKNITGITPNDYIKLIRLNQSVQLLASGKYKINEVCYMVGFNTPSYFSKCFYEQFGKLPKEFIETI